MGRLITRLMGRRRVTDLLFSVLLVPTAYSTLELGDQVTASDVTINVRSKRDPLGRNVLNIFTTEKRLLESFPAGSYWVGLRGEDVLRLFLRGEWDVMVIDPGGEGLEVSRGEADALLD